MGVDAALNEELAAALGEIDEPADRADQPEAGIRDEQGSAAEPDPFVPPSVVVVPRIHTAITSSFGAARISRNPDSVSDWEVWHITGLRLWYPLRAVGPYGALDSDAESLMTEYGERSELDDRRAPAVNRRAAFRLPVALDVLAMVPPGTRGATTWKREHEGPCLRTVTEDLSVGGLRFRAPERLERGTSVELELDLEGKRVDLVATVARTTVDSFGAAVGVQFADGGPERQVAQSLISRFLFTRERRRLPQVPVMYAVRFTADGIEGIIDGTTEECSPGFAWLLLNHATEAGRRALVNVRVDAVELALHGRTVSSVKTEHLWRTGVEFDDILPRWRDVIIERREGRR